MLVLNIEIAEKQTSSGEIKEGKQFGLLHQTSNATHQCM